jgi:hypothetical protein
MKNTFKNPLLVAAFALLAVLPTVALLPGCNSVQENAFATAMANPQTTSAIANSTAAALAIASIKDPTIAKYIPAIQAGLPGVLAVSGSLSGAVAAATAAANTTVGGNLTAAQAQTVENVITTAVVSAAPAAANVTVLPVGNTTAAPTPSPAPTSWCPVHATTFEDVLSLNSQNQTRAGPACLADRLG